jgi:ribose 5-phosphate isomerase A
VQSSTAMKRTAAEAALRLVDREAVLGVGSGSTVNAFLRVLQESGLPPRGAVAASLATAKLLDSGGVTVFPLAEVDSLKLYIDGADEIDPSGRMIKGGGGAHTAEKRIAEAADRFVCIVDESKLVDRLGERVPVPLEVLPAELAFVVKQLAVMGAQTDLRQERADSGNLLLDASGLDLSDPERVERELEEISGVVACGIFAGRRADIAIVGLADGSVREIRFSE